MGSIDSWVAYWSTFRPSQPALQARGTVTTWKQLHDRATARAHSLRSRGVTGGSRVGVTDQLPGLVEDVLACALLGAVAVLGETSSQSEVVVEETPPHGGAEPGSPATAAGATMADPLLLLGQRHTADDVILTHADVEAVAVAGMAADGLVPGTRVAVRADATGAAGLAALFAALHAGATIVLDHPHTDADIVVVPAENVRDVVERTGSARPRLVKVLGVLDDDTRRATRDAGLAVRESYGVAEAGGFNLHQQMRRDGGGCLVPALGHDVLVVDGVGAPCGVGEPGELLLRGPVGSGEVSVEGHGAGWLRTGDRAVLEPGGVRILDRLAVVEAS